MDKPPKIVGVGRILDSETGITMFFDRRLTDDEIALLKSSINRDLEREFQDHHVPDFPS